MRRGRVAALATCAVIVAATAAAPPSPAAPPTPPPPHSVAVPPPAPSPTDDGNSPMAPDPHPPLGGLGPDGRPVGGAALRSRGVLRPPGTPPLPTSLTAAAWVLVDLDSGDVLAARDPHGRYQPASILKLLTVDTLLPLLPGNRVVTVGRAAADAEGSRAGLVEHGRYTVDQLFEGLLLVSGNDTAEALADAAGGHARTVSLMNRTARQLGAYDTLVQTPSGLDGWQQLTSAYDMALILRADVHQPRFLHYDRALSAVLPQQQVNGYGPVTLQNQSTIFLTTVPGAFVAKTGYTDAAVHTFAGAIARHGRRLGVIFLRAQRWPTDQWQQATDLMNWGFALPAGTPPVGHLVDPTPPPAVSHARASVVRASSQPTGATQRGTARLYLGLVLLVLAAAALSLRRRAGRRRRGRRKPPRP